MSVNRDSIELLIKQVMKGQYFAVLASVSREQPYGNLVAFTFTDNLKTIRFVTNRLTRKYENILSNPRVSLLIDNRKNQPGDLSKAVAITAIGTASEETNLKGKAQAAFIARYPGLKDFVNHQDTALIAISVQEYIVAGFIQTQRLILK